MTAEHPARDTPPATGRVVVVGSANVDLVVPVPRHPAGGETVLGGSLARHPGGKGANQAVAAARAGGADTSFIGALGSDESGDLLRESLESAGVDTALVTRVPEPTGTALITVSADGENAIVVAPGANSRVEVGPGQSERIAQADVVLAQLEIPLEAVTAAAAARREGARFVLNAAPSRELPDHLWSEIDVLVVNEHEASDLACDDAEPDELARALASRGPSVVITLGGEGSVVVEGGRDPVHVSAFPVDAVDTTGAGDTFCGVLAAALASGSALVDAVRVAAAAGALATTAAGAQASVPSATAVAELVRGT